MTQNPLAEKSDVGKVVVVFMFLVEFGGWYGRGRHIKTRIPSQLWQLRMVLKKKKIKWQNETKADKLVHVHEIRIFFQQLQNS